MVFHELYTFIGLMEEIAEHLFEEDFTEAFTF